MGKTRKSRHTTLGNSLIKKSRKPEWGSKVYTDRHTQDEQNGLKSVTQESSYEEFLATAALADTEFTAEKLNVKFVSLTTVDPLGEEENFLTDAEKKLVVVPRRPEWTKDMTREELEVAEKEAFLNWRRHMAQLQEKDGITPFERNIEVWRQLWRVVEKSEIVVQILDGRNPLLYRCEDLEAYVREKGKRNVLLINKADFLSESQRNHWSRYFESINLPHAFYSAVMENDSVLKKEEISQEEDSEESQDKGSSDVETEPADLKITKDQSATPILRRHELIEFLKSFKTGSKLESNGVFTVGFCGHPNVGKSSTINSLMAKKKTSVSSTPGKTKHFQTLFLENDLMLCDCPGLVMPSFGGSQGEMVLGGILPIDTLTNYHQAMALLSHRIPKAVLQKKYGITLPKDFNHEDLLNSYAAIRGFMTLRGLPDASRACRIILKDYVNGRILYCHAPPNVDQDEYFSLSHEHTATTISGNDAMGEDEIAKEHGNTEIKEKAPTLKKPNVEGKLDAMFFAPYNPTAHIKGSQYISSGLSSGSSTSSNSNTKLSDKPWKKHNNHNKREKLRRVYRHLDVE